MKSNTLRRSKRRRSSGAFQTECLEARTLLTGTVRVTLRGNDLEIVGNARDNAIAIDTTAGSLEDLIVGLDGTSIKISRRVMRRADDIELLGDINFKMRGGDDAVFIYAPGADFQGGMHVNLGLGNDTFAMLGDDGDSAFLGGDLTVTNPGGEATVGIANINIDGDLNYRGSGRSDLVALCNVFVDSETDIRTRGGRDTVMIVGSEVERSLEVRTGGGRDAVLVTDSVVGGDASLRAGGGSDFAFVDASNFVGGSISERGLEGVTDSVDDIPDAVFSAAIERLERVEGVADFGLSGDAEDAIFDSLDKLFFAFSGDSDT